MTKMIGAKIVYRRIIWNYGDYSIPYPIGGRLKRIEAQREPRQGVEAIV